MDDYVVVGRVGRAHGIRGEVSVEVRTDEPERRFTTGGVLGAGAGAGAGAGRLVVSDVRRHQGRLLLCFDGVADRTAAEALHGTELTVRVDRSERPEDPEEFYDHQLVGLHVQTTDGQQVGRVERIEHGVGQELLVIDADGREVLFPFVAVLVPEVDLAGGRVVIDDKPGLLGST